MIKKHNKGFTIIELIIIVGVVAILSAVLIPTFVNLTQQSKDVTAQQFVRNVNMQLYTKEQSEGKNNLCRDAIRDAKDLGYDVLSFKSNTYELFYNEETDRFYLENKNNRSKHYPSDAVISTEKYHTWRFIKNNDFPDLEYSYYALNDFQSTIVNVRASFDCGNNWTINNINLDTTDREDHTERQIKIITNGFNVNINAPYDDVSHYRYAYTLNVTAVNSEHCHHEYGYIEQLTNFGEGKFIIEKSAQFRQTKMAILNILNGKDYEIKNSDDNYQVDRYYDEENGEVAEKYIEPVEQHHDIEYDESDDLEPSDDISELVERFNYNNDTTYTTTTHSYFNKEGLKQYYRHYHKNYAQDKVSFYTKKAYYTYPLNDTYLEYTNQGYVNINSNYYRFALKGDTVASRLNYEVTQADLKLAQEHKSYQDDMFTIADINSSYLSSKEFKKVNDHKYASTNRDACNDFLHICAPTLTNEGSYMTFIKVSIELYEDNTMRIRLYANTTQSGKLIDEHLDESKPNWYLLFSEATIYSIDETTFTPTINTKIGEIHMS